MDRYEYKNQLETLQKLSHIGLWEYDLKTNVLSWTDEVYNIFELDKNIFTPTYENFLKIIHPDDKKVVEDAYLKSIKNQTVYKQIHRLLMNDGRVKWVKDECVTQFDEKGVALYSKGAVQDITELTLAKLKAENEHDKLKAVFDNAPDLLWIKDPKGVYISCNKRFEELYGAKEKDIVNKTDYDFVDKELGDFFINRDKLAMNSNIPLSNFEELTFADGHKEYTQTIKSKIVDSKGEIIGVLGIGRDITELKVKELQLIEQQKELQSIYGTTKDGLAIVDMETNFIKVNKAFCDITGLSEEELLKTSSIALIGDENKEELVKSNINEIILKDSVDNFERVYVAKNRRINITLSATLMPDKNHILLSMKDVTKNKLFEEQSKLAAMGEMIGNIAHQWRQPLSVITTVSSNVKFHKEYDELKNYDVTSDMNTIMQQADYLSKTIDDFRNFIKNSKEINLISIKSVVEKTLSLLHAAMVNNGINVISNLNDDLEIEANENELIQSFINIINNAKDAENENVKNSDDKLIFVETLKEDSNLIVLIKDNGGGIPNTIMNRIFEPYFTTKHQSVGTGIGLSMTYKMLVERQHALINVYNEEYVYDNKNYKGACFKITFTP
ncbi:PAS sensor-containing signal transduction histidine kinase [Aliarcobacter cibarius]|uniref:histidine kinase n=4 Tax=Aliarcobacter cibarius TaxID=255507 RepID=A0A7L5JLR1_9BACT|nr:PAS domain-containing sensor histidine kinase [Aliarcobacter cibarius]QKJ26086.1 PAS sensor-containing signal transduction histidine kinase [Aliarcobacter cibarius]